MNPTGELDRIYQFFDCLVQSETILEQYWIEKAPFQLHNNEKKNVSDRKPAFSILVSDCIISGLRRTIRDGLSFEILCVIETINVISSISHPTLPRTSHHSAILSSPPSHKTRSDDEAKTAPATHGQQYTKVTRPAVPAFGL